MAHKNWYFCVKLIKEGDTISNIACFGPYDNVLDTAKAINGDFYTDELTVIRNSVKTSSTETQSQIKKTYNTDCQSDYAYDKFINMYPNYKNNASILVETSSRMPKLISDFVATYRAYKTLQMFSSKVKPFSLKDKFIELPI